MFSEEEKEMEKVIIPNYNSYEAWLQSKKQEEEYLSSLVNVDEDLPEEVIDKLDQAYLFMASDTQAAFIAGISKKRLERYLDTHPEYVERKERLTNMVKYQAKANISQKVLSGDVPLSQWVADRLMKEEGFSTRQEVTGENGAPLVSVVSYKTQEIERTDVIDAKVDDDTKTEENTPYEQK